MKVLLQNEHICYVHMNIYAICYVFFKENPVHKIKNQKVEGQAIEYRVKVQTFKLWEKNWGTDMKKETIIPAIKELLWTKKFNYETWYVSINKESRRWLTGKEPSFFSYGMQTYLRYCKYI